MEIYTDKEKNKAVIIADSYELNLLHSGQWWASQHWYKKANGREDTSFADLDKGIADAHIKLGQELANAYEKLNKENDK